VIDDGVTGFVVGDLDAAVRATVSAGELDRRRVRDVFEKRFSASRMAADYLAVYERLIGRPTPPVGAPARAASDNGNRRHLAAGTLP
jgi:hypothetical protein